MYADLARQFEWAASDMLRKMEADLCGSVLPVAWAEKIEAGARRRWQIKVSVPMGDGQREVLVVPEVFRRKRDALVAAPMVQAGAEALFRLMRKPSPTSGLEQAVFGRAEHVAPISLTVAESQ